MKIRRGTPVDAQPAPQAPAALAVSTKITAGKVAVNHNEALTVRTSVRAGGISLNHAEASAA